METQDIDESLYEHYSFTADSGQQALRVDKFLMNRIENATRNKIQQAAKAGSVRVNDVVVKSNYKVKGGDQVKVLFTHPPYENLLVQPMPWLPIISSANSAFCCANRVLEFFKMEAAALTSTRPAASSVFYFLNRRICT